MLRPGARRWLRTGRGCPALGARPLLAELGRGRGFCAGPEAGAGAGAAEEPAKPKGLGGPRTFYDILEVSRRAKQEEIKSSYRKLAKKYHPDKNTDDPQAEMRFKEVQEAYTTLSEPFKRALYDQDLQFSTYGSRVTQEVEREKWTEHWEKETPEERELRKERYKRYAAGERNDLPPEPFKVAWAPIYMLTGIFTIFYICVRAPDWFDAQSDPTFCDPAHDDSSVPLVLAFHDPVMNRWERLPEDAAPPSPEELYAHYRRKRPELMQALDLKNLPKVRLTTLLVPRTDAVRAVFRPMPPEGGGRAAANARAS